MSREIKFRAWHEFRKAMLPVTSLEFGNGGLSRIVAGDALDFMPDENVLMQFTGLLDKNNREIYEGDIVKGRNPWDTYGDRLNVVRYEGGTWNYSYVMCEYAELPRRDWEVVGNIWENPELVKKENKP